MSKDKPQNWWDADETVSATAPAKNWWDDDEPAQAAPKPAPAMQMQPAPKPAPMPMQSGQPNISPMGGVGEFDPKAFAGIKLPEQQSLRVTDPSMLMLKPEARTLGNYYDANRPTPQPSAPFLGAAQRQQIANERAFGQEPVDAKAIVAGMDRKTAELQTAADPFKSVFGNANVGGSMSLGGAPAIGVDPARPSMGTGDVYKAIGSAPVRLERAAVEAGQSILNIPSDTANSMGAASAQEVDPMVAMRNVNRAPQLTERVGQPAQDFKALPRFDFQGAKIPIPEWLDSTTGQFEEQIMQYAIGRGLIGNAAKGGNFMAQGAKDAATVLSAFDSSTPRISEIAADFMNANGLGWMAERDPNNPIMERVKNGLEELFTSVAPAKAIEAIPRGLSAIDNVFKAPTTPTNAFGARPGPIDTAALEPRPPAAAPPAAAAPTNAPAAPPAPPQPPVTAVPSFQRQPQPIPTATAQAAGAPPIQPPPPAVATANAAVPTPGAVPPAGTLTPVGNGVAVDSYHQLPVKTREALLRALESSGMTRQQAFDAITSLNDLPPDRANMFEFELIRRYGGPDKFPNLQANLTTMGSDFSIQTPRKGGSPQDVMNKSLLDQAQSEGDYLTRTAEQLFGEGKVATKEELEAFRTQLGGRYRTQLAETYPGMTRLRNAASKQALAATVDAGRKNLTDYLLRPDVIEQVPPWVQDQVMMQVSDDLRWLQKDDAGLQFASKANPELSPLLTSDQTLRYSPQLWRTLVQMYPTQVGHSLQSAYRAAIDDAFSGVSNAIDRTTAKKLMRLRGQSRVRANASDPNKRGVGLLHLLEEASPGYKKLRQEYGDVVGAQKAADMPDSFFRVAKDEEALADFVDVYENELTPLQQNAVRNGITTQIRQALKNKTEFTQPWEVDAASRGHLPNMTAISSQTFLEALPKVFGRDGERMADAIRLSRANVDNIQAINKNFASGTPKGIDIKANANQLYEHPAATKLNPVDNFATTMGSVGLGTAFVPGGQMVSIGLLTGAAGRALYRAYKQGKSLSPSQKEALAEWLFKPRRETDPMPPSTPRGFSKLGYAGNVATGAGIGAAAGAASSGGDPTTTAEGAVIGALGGGARAGLRARRAGASIIKPPPARGPRRGPPPFGGNRVTGAGPAPQITPPGSPPVQNGFFGGGRQPPKPPVPKAPVAAKDLSAEHAASELAFETKASAIEKAGNFGDFTVSRGWKMPEGTLFEVRKGNNVVGTFVFEKRGWSDEYSIHADVKPEFQRQGVATAFYDHVENAIGQKLKPSGTQSPEGAAFTRSRQSSSSVTPLKPAPKPPTRQGMGSSKPPMDESAKTWQRQQWQAEKGPVDDKVWFHWGASFEAIDPAKNQLGLHVGSKRAAWDRRKHRAILPSREKEQLSELVTRGDFAQAPDMDQWTAADYVDSRAYEAGLSPDARWFDSRFPDLWNELDAVAKSNPTQEKWAEAVRDATTKRGLSGWQYSNTVEDINQPSRIIMDPTAARRTDAKFDPAESSSSKLLAGLGGPSGAGAAGGGILGYATARDANDDGVVDAQERANGALGGAVSLGVGGAVAGKAFGARAAKRASGVQAQGFGAGRPKPPPNRLAVPKQLAASLNKSKVSPPLREKLTANAALPPGERKSIMEATGWDNEILRIAAPFIREGTRMDTEIGAKVAALIKQANANPVEYALRQTMAKGAYEEAQKRFKQASGARSRAATNLENLRTRNMLNPNQPAVKQQLSVHKQRRDDAEQFLSEAARLRDEAKVLLDRADIEMMSLKQVRDYANAEIQRITDALGANRPNTKGAAMLPAYNPMGKPKPGPINPAGAKPNKQAAEELAHMLFEADQAELFAKLQAGDITPQNRKALGMAASYYARHPGMALLTAGGAGVTGAGAVAIYADQKKRSEDVREVARQRQAEPERPGFKWDWQTQSKKRDFVVTLQSALNDLGYEIGSVDGSMIRADGKQTKTQKALEHFLWSLDNTRVPGSPVTEDDWKAIEREALAARRKRA